MWAYWVKKALLGVGCGRLGDIERKKTSTLGRVGKKYRGRKQLEGAEEFDGRGERDIMGM